MDNNLANEILVVLEKFNQPIEELGELFMQVRDNEERKCFRRVLAEIMVKLECDITQPIRKLAK